MEMLVADGLHKSYPNRRVLRGVSLSVSPGEMLGVVGPNGSGKTTLVRLLTGEESPDAGEVRLDGRPLSDWSQRERARRLAVLPQEGLPSVPFSVREVVEMGRHPHQGFWPWAGVRDRQVVERVLQQTGLQADRDRQVNQLSGGERQRVAIAKAMAQGPRVLILDEPTTFLDIAHQLGMLDWIRSWGQKECVAVLIVLHDLNLAALYCDRILMLKEGTCFAQGTPSDTLTPDRIREVYGVEPVLTQHPVTHAPQVLLQPGGGDANLPKPAVLFPS